ncbi:MAG: hypothetical protein QME77_12650, partial [bacterium]|nr:hypothetical protein [bacterium]
QRNVAVIQILVNDRPYDGDDLSPEEATSLVAQEFRVDGWEFSIDRDAVPEAADWPVFVVTLGGLFILGKPIRDNLDAWKDLAKRFGALVRRLRARLGPVRLDDEGCRLLAFESVYEAFGESASTIEELGVLAVRAREYSTRDATSLTHHPDTVSAHAFRVNDEILVLAIVKSSGSVTLLHREDLSLYGF